MRRLYQSRFEQPRQNRLQFVRAAGQSRHRGCRGFQLRRRLGATVEQALHHALAQRVQHPVVTRTGVKRQSIARFRPIRPEPKPTSRADGPRCRLGNRPIRGYCLHRLSTGAFTSYILLRYAITSAGLHGLEQVMLPGQYEPLEFSCTQMSTTCAFVIGYLEAAFWK